jgi:DNA processing protein
VAIVGSRRATESGRRIAERIGRILGGAGLTIVSGMARGIDGAAHRGALSAGGDTVGVLGSGLGIVYPASNRDLFREVSAKGALVSEFVPGAKARAHHFPKRNRIIAALSRAVIVVEAGERSGALITVDHALDLGRPVLAVPGSVENPQARGTNRLLRDGARALVETEAVLDEVEPFFSPGLLRDCPPEPDRAAVPVPEELEALWNSLTAVPKRVDELAQEAGMSPDQALAGLSALELGGWAEQQPGMRFQRR